MLTLGFDQFMEGKYPDDFQMPFQMYVLRDMIKTLYVGISTRNVWNRWFSDRGHMTQNVDGRWFGISAIGQHVVENMPSSLQYVIDLWTLQDGLSTFETELRQAGYSLERTDIHCVEPIAIQRLRPTFNVTYAGRY